MKKLSSKGFAHWIVPALVVVAIGGIGTYFLTASHAATPASYVIATNVGKGARAPITVFLTNTSDSTGNRKQTYSDVNSLYAVNASRKYSVEVNFHGHPNATYYGKDLYKYNGSTKSYVRATDVSPNTIYSTHVQKTNLTSGILFSVPKGGTKTINLCNRFSEPEFYVYGRKGLYTAKACTLNNTTTAIFRNF